MCLRSRWLILLSTLRSWLPSYQVYIEFLNQIPVKPMLTAIEIIMKVAYTITKHEHQLEWTTYFNKLLVVHNLCN
ncbi:unnamed protein product [Blepharisma stoltei]|uniref:Maturase K n=1 Tax=Blepharisma stoltei TaxID=1481888 RepID=A0AAU9IQP6_9CILI|nr:unnamed protein product [Blepharisma stoltei]